MIFGLKTTPATFQRTIMEIFGEYIPAFMQVFLDDFAVYGTAAEHFQHLRLCLDRCRVARLSLNPAKCAFGITSGALLGHILSKEVVDPNKISAIIQAKTLANAKALSRFLGQIRWHSRMIRYLADFVSPLHVVVYRTPFKWTETEDKAYEALKVAAHGAQLVSTSLLRQQKAVNCGAQLFHYGAGGTGNYIQYQQI